MYKIPISELHAKAGQIRRNLIDLIYRAKSGHLDTSLSLVEVWLGLVYSDFFRCNPKDGAWSERDAVFLSEGHACPVQYLVNADLGYFDRHSVFDGNRRPWTPFQGHTQRSLAHGLENSNGSLGIGLWQAYGFALEWPQYVFCIAGDGEFEEPSSIGLLAATHLCKPAGNFTLLLNYNRLAQDAPVDIGPLGKVAEAYGWYVIEVDGHNFEALDDAYQCAVADKVRPKFVICNTIKGKGGDPSREGRLGYHGKPPGNEIEYQAYLQACVGASQSSGGAA